MYNKFMVIAFFSVNSMGNPQQSLSDKTVLWEWEWTTKVGTNRIWNQSHSLTSSCQQSMDFYFISSGPSKSYCGLWQNFTLLYTRGFKSWCPSASDTDTETNKQVHHCHQPLMGHASIQFSVLKNPIVCNCVLLWKYMLIDLIWFDLIWFEPFLKAFFKKMRFFLPGSFSPKEIFLKHHTH